MPDLQQLPDSYRRCRLLVDGYNLMHAIGAIQHGDTQPKALQRGRDRLIEKIAQRIPSSSRKWIWIVFDSEVAPKNLPDVWQRDGIMVVFSRGWNSADELLQSIIAAHHSPKQLIVISSDHAVQRKALARAAHAWDSDRWIEAIDAMRENGTSIDSSETVRDEDLRPDHISIDDRERWLREFGFEQED